MRPRLKTTGAHGARPAQSDQSGTFVKRGRHTPSTTLAVATAQQDPQRHRLGAERGGELGDRHLTRERAGCEFGLCFIGPPTPMKRVFEQQNAGERLGPGPADIVEGAVHGDRQEAWDQRERERGQEDPGCYPADRLAHQRILRKLGEKRCYPNPTSRQAIAPIGADGAHGVQGNLIRRRMAKGPEGDGAADHRLPAKYGAMGPDFQVSAWQGERPDRRLRRAVTSKATIGTRINGRNPAFRGPDMFARWFALPFVAILLAAPVTPANAVQCGGDFNTFIADFSREAQGKGFRSSVISTGLGGVTPDPAVMAFDRRQRGTFNKTFEQYAATRVPPPRVKRARTMMSATRRCSAGSSSSSACRRSSSWRSGRMETDNGATWASCRWCARWRPWRMIAAAPSCSSVSCRALQIVQRGDLPLGEMIGAYAGEIGQTQFLPSSYLKYGVDFDGNGHVDLRRAVPDVLASTANCSRPTAGRPASLSRARATSR